MLNKSMFSSKKDDWRTPLDLFKKLDSEFHFDLDVCATRKNSLCRQYMKQCLLDGWPKRFRAFMNPPYGRYIGDFVGKACREAERHPGSFVVCLLPSRTDTKWFHQFCLNGRAKIRFIKGRLKFQGALYSAPFPSMIVIFGRTLC
jgi:phage N-6-adenine-methyltransferase